MTQSPIDSPFTPASTAADVVKGLDLSSKIAIVTGGYAGLGLEATKALLSAGATVVVSIRTAEKAAKNLEGLAVETFPCDLLDPKSIDAFADHFLASNRPLHILINNAGIMACPLRRDSRGYESQFSTNHLGHFQLTARLWPALAKAGGARVVNVSSGAHHSSDVIDDWNFEQRPYHPLMAYGQSKTANVLFAVGLEKRAAKYGVHAFALHPGIILTTDLSRWRSPEESLPSWRQFGLVDEDGKQILNPLRQSKTPEQGAATEVWAATSPLLEGKGGLYLENSNISPPAETLVPLEPGKPGDARGYFGVKAHALNVESADRLWVLSEKLTGVTFAI
jgi:NAD(P)-dependent dehydrogenase (short-subunit alcohol dehydrogenase family)